jgi:hypothetical protein
MEEIGSQRIFTIVVDGSDFMKAIEIMEPAEAHAMDSTTPGEAEDIAKLYLIFKALERVR